MCCVITCQCKTECLWIYWVSHLMGMGTNSRAKGIKGCRREVTLAGSGGFRGRKNTLEQRWTHSILKSRILFCELWWKQAFYLIPTVLFFFTPHMRNKLNIENKDHDAGHFIFFPFTHPKPLSFIPVDAQQELSRDNSSIFLTCTSASNTTGNLQPFVKSTVSLVKHRANRWVSPFCPGNS